MEVTALTATAYSGDLSVTNQNVIGFAIGDLVLLESFGMGNAELARITGFTGDTGMTFAAALKYGHTVDTVVTRLKYDQIEFSWGATSVTPTLVLVLQAIEATDFYTTYDDTTHTTGYGFARGHHSITNLWEAYGASQPYGGYSRDSLKHLIDSTYSNLTDKDRKFITREDIITWLNDGYNEAYSALIQVNNEYYLVPGYAITIVAGTSTYTLPADFYDLLKVYGVNSTSLTTTIYNERDANSNVSNFTSESGYALYGNTIKVFPEPTSGFTLYIDYQAKPASLTDDDERFNLPKVDGFLLSDYASMRGKMKANNFTAADRWEKRWTNGLQRLIVYAINRTRASRSFSLNEEQNV